jgi:2-polyprenyl-6-methoxyphenol hydroxylase-like FAD-dependent oxidoreductase
MWAVATRRDGLEATADGGSLRDAAMSEAASYENDFRKLIEASDPEENVLVPIKAAPALTPQRASRVTLIGDAIHTMPPFGAHGANTALRDAQALANCLYLEESKRSLSLKEEIAAYEREMSAYSRSAVRGSLRMMTLAVTQSTLKRLLFRTILRFTSKGSQSGRIAAERA